MDFVQFLVVAILNMPCIPWPTLVTGEAVLHNKETCDAYRSNFANENPTYYRWNGSEVRNCITDFSKRTVIQKHYICVEIVSFHLQDCSADVKYYGINFDSPKMTFNCYSRPRRPIWCCNTEKVRVKFHANQSSDSNFFLRVYALTPGSITDNCSPSTTTPSTTTTSDPFNTEVLSGTPVCGSSRVNMVKSNLQYYKWQGFWGNSCTVGFHKEPDIYSDQMICIEILNYSILDCSTRIHYYGLTTSGRPFKTFSCDSKVRPRWCCSVNTINIKFDVITYTNDEFFFGVFKVPAGYVTDECPDIQNLDEPPPCLNISNKTHYQCIPCKLVIFLLPIVAFILTNADCRSLSDF